LVQSGASWHLPSAASTAPFSAPLGTIVGTFSYALWAMSAATL
jgi:hypothetical protein